MTTRLRSIRRMSAQESEARRRDLRNEQKRRDAARMERLHAAQRRRNRIEGLKAAGVLAVIIAFFGLIFLAAMFNLITRPVDLIPSPF